MFSAFVLLVACERPGESDLMADYEVVPSASVPVPKPTLYASASAPVPASASAPSMSAASAPSGSASASASASNGKPPPPPAKTYDCGDKGKPDCPMQRWMKGVAGGAVISGDAAKLTRAFQAMSKAPPGMGGWSSIAATGASIAQGGDFDGAKAQCKVCHARYQSAYRASMRDMPWP